MARDRDNRSPSPAGSHARRRRDDGHSRRDDHRERRDDRRDDRRDRDRRDDRRRRSRSRSPERRRDHRDREYRRRERSVERYDDRQADSYHPRRRSRERGDRRRDSRDDRRRDGSADSRKRRDRSRSRPRDNEVRARALGKTDADTSQPKAQSAEEQQAARQAKLKAWKQKVAAEQALKEAELQAAGGPKSILIEIDKKEGLSPATSSPQSPADASPVPYGGKFDPKAIAKKAHASATTSSVLGGDVATPLPKLASSSIPTPAPSRKSATTAKSANHQEPRGPVSGFGLGAKVADEKTKSAVFEEEQSTKRKLERLPTPPLGEVNGDPESEEDVEMQADEDMLADEDTLAAERAAAETRQEARSSVERVDTVMVEAEEEVEEADPLDAFMSGLTATPLKGKPRQAPQALFDDEDNGLTAMEANPEDILAMANKKKKKDLPTVNHAKVKYEPFRKTFFSQPVDMADWTEADVANLRLELDGIKVRGLDVPKPVQRWAQCGLGVQSLDVIQRLGYSAPTSIQAQAIPAITSGRDVIGVAKTGSGKTIAFLLPMFRHIKDQRALDMLEGPIGLIMTPTRELATQIHKDCKPFLKALNLRAVCAYGGAPIKDQIADLKRGAEIIVCTPGRMIDLLAANSGRVTNLRRVTYMVLDEADRMFDMGFEPQVMKILANIRPDRQTVLFSATFPRQMEALARKTLSKPVEIIVGGRSVVAPEITQVVEVRNEDQKFIRLLELLGNMYEDDKNEDDRALIFVDRQESADALLRELMRKGYPCMSIHGGKDQIDRDSTIDDFKAGVVPILVATSVAARGLDVKQLKLVVNYDAPNHLEDYVHRAGRTGRAGNTGTAVTFLTDEQDRYAVDIAKALKQSGQPVPEEVQKLVEVFNEKVKAGKEKALAGGFGGKGLERLDQERDATKARERKTFKTGDEGEDEEKDKETGDDLFAKAASGIKPLDSQSEFIPGVPKGIDLDGKITVHRTEKDGPQNQMDKVAAAVQNIAAKLSKAGVMRQGVPIDNKGPDAGAFHATLEINDFPQKARWAVTNRTNVAKILESTGTSITTKGSFYAAGKDPGPTGDPKLYILVEGDTEVVVHDAMRELMRLLKEGTIAAAEGEPSRGAPGRYTVV